jgi:hypothetical protein
MKVEPGQVKSIFLHALEDCAPGEWAAPTIRTRSKP